MRRADKVRALLDVWAVDLERTFGFVPRAIDRGEYAKVLKQASDTQLDNALAAHGIDPVTGEFILTGVW